MIYETALALVGSAPSWELREIVKDANACRGFTPRRALRLALAAEVVLKFRGRDIVAPPPT